MLRISPIRVPEDAYEMTVTEWLEIQVEGEMADVDVWVYALSSVEGTQQRVTVHLYGGQSLKGAVVELDRSRNTVVLDEYAQGSAATRHESPVHTILLTAVQAVTVHKQD